MAWIRIRMGPEILPGSGTRKIQSWIRIRNISFRIHNTATNAEKKKILQKEVLYSTYCITERFPNGKSSFLHQEIRTVKDRTALLLIFYVRKNKQHALRARG